MNIATLNPQLGVVIVDYNSHQQSLEAALAAAETAGRPGIAVIVDNGSSSPLESALSWIERLSGLGWQHEVVALPANRGFAGGVNAGLARLGDQADFVLLLNPDARPKPGCLPALLDEMTLHAEASAVGPMLTSADGAPHRYDHGQEPTLLNQLLLRLDVLLRSPVAGPFEAEEADWISAGCMLLRARALRQVGTFDEGFFLYFEDIDWCRRARQAGWTIRYQPLVQAVHTNRPLYGERWRRLLYMRGMRRYYLKHYGAGSAVALSAGQQLYQIAISWLLRSRLIK